MTARLWTAMLVLLAATACKYVGTPNKDASASSPAPADASYSPPPTPAPANPGCLKSPSAPLGTSPSSGSNGVTNTASSTASTTGTASGSALDLTAPSGGAAPAPVLTGTNTSNNPGYGTSNGKSRFQSPGEAAPSGGCS